MTKIERETVADALENDRCGRCGSVDHFREDCPRPTPLPMEWLYPPRAPYCHKVYRGFVRFDRDEGRTTLAAVSACGLATVPDVSYWDPVGTAQVQAFVGDRRCPVCVERFGA